MENEDFGENKRIGQFAINVYEAIEIYQNDPDSDQNVKEVFNMADDDEILLKFFNNESDFAPEFMIFTEVATESIVLVIRGSSE